MNSLVLQAPAKINWRLCITGRRPNGYHELDMIMQTISLHDTISLHPSDHDELFVNGASEESAEHNLIVKAAKALSAFTGKSICARFELVKRIPSMAGLGGGSSDCAQALLGLNRMYDLGLSIGNLHEIALSLGADVPFFLYGGLCRVQGIGEKVQQLPFAPKAPIVLCHVQPGLSTPAVYSQFDRVAYSGEEGSTDAFITKLESEDYCGLEAFNALEAPAIELLPPIKGTEKALTACGAAYTLMSGSGSAVYGVFGNATAAQAALDCIPGSLLAYTSAALA